MTDTDGHGVLIVDDDFRVAALHAAIVDAVRGFHVVARAGSIAAARAALADHPEIELVLLDVYLPDGSGIDVIADLDRDCFVVGAETDADAVRTAMRAGALAYLIKPFPDTELARRLAGYAQYRRALAAPNSECWTSSTPTRCSLPTRSPNESGSPRPPRAATSPRWSVLAGSRCRCSTAGPGVRASRIVAPRGDGGRVRSQPSTEPIV